MILVSLASNLTIAVPLLFKEDIKITREGISNCYRCTGRHRNYSYEEQNHGKEVSLTEIAYVIRCLPTVTCISSRSTWARALCSYCFPFHPLRRAIFFFSRLPGEPIIGNHANSTTHSLNLQAITVPLTYRAIITSCCSNFSPSIYRVAR